MNSRQPKLDLRDPEPTESELRDAHRSLRITRSFEDTCRVPWMLPLLRLGARMRMRRRTRS